MTAYESTPRGPVVVIGAGPVGLAAAARLHVEGLSHVVLEAGTEAGAAVRAWGHVRLFTPWRYLVDEAARSLLEAERWTAPDADHVPTGHELVDHYLVPLAATGALSSVVRFGTRVDAITRSGMDKLESGAREQRGFTAHATGPDGTPITVEAGAVIDATGTYASPNPLGSAGVPAAGERAAADRLFYGIPDVRGRDRARFAGKRIGVVGSGHSAFNTLLDLQALREESGAEVTWFVRAYSPGLWGGEDADALSERGALGRRMRELAESGRMTIESPFATTAVERSGDEIVLVDRTGKGSAPLDQVVVVTGFRPDLTLTRELRLGLDPVVEAPTALAPLIDPNLHSCGTVPPHGYRELSHPETDYFSVGMKSYGRAPTFLMITGYEQVRSVVKALAGDLEAAGRVELDLPETGVCSAPSTGAFEGSDGSCCAPPIEDSSASCCAPAVSEPEEECCAPTCCEPAPVSIGIGGRRDRTGAPS